MIGKISCDVCDKPIAVKDLVTVSVESGSTKGANGDLIVRKSVHLCSKECTALTLREMLLGFEGHRVACVDKGLHAWVGETCTKCGAKFPVDGSRAKLETPEMPKAPVQAQAAQANGTGAPHPFDADEAPKKRGPRKAKPADPKQNDFVVPSDGSDAKAGAQRTGDQSFQEPPTWCATCGEPRFFERAGDKSVWKCKSGHEGEPLAVKDGLVGERDFSGLVYQLEKRGVKVRLLEFVQWPVMRRTVARAWVEQGGEAPDWLEEMVTKKPASARAVVPPGPDVPDVDLCLKLGINPTDPGAPTYGNPERRPAPASPPTDFNFTFE